MQDSCKPAAVQDAETPMLKQVDDAKEQAKLEELKRQEEQAAKKKAKRQRAKQRKKEEKELERKETEKRQQEQVPFRKEGCKCQQVRLLWRRIPRLRL